MYTVDSKRFFVHGSCIDNISIVQNAELDTGPYLINIKLED